ncbi:MAG: DNA polymerase III subunit epsilon [Pseudomonadota bacterium]|nr:DNA polymerase III subunit epsilon [Pseudomonadota bacterium]
MREIVFDTETTGLDPSDGHRVVELGCVELIDHLPSGNSFHRYLNPERLVPPETTRVHGLTDEFLADKPLFADVVDEFLEFLGDAPLVIHNAVFDIKFINAELARLRREPIPLARAIDTIDIAKAKIPGARYSLDDLCKRFGIDLSARSKHGALLDAELTALLYLELIGGRQTRLELAPAGSRPADDLQSRSARQRPAPLAPRLSEAEAAAHALFIEKELGGEALWNRRRTN